MRRSTLCLRSVLLPLRWLHPAEGSFWGSKGTALGDGKGFRVGGPAGFGGSSGGKGFRERGKPLRGNLQDAGPADGRAYSGLVLGDLRVKFGGKGVSGTKKKPRSPVW